MLRSSRYSCSSSFFDKDEIYGSAYASAIYISSVMKLPKDQKVYVIGMSGIEDELNEEGVSFIGGTVCEPTVLFLQPN